MPITTAVNCNSARMEPCIWPRRRRIRRRSGATPQNTATLLGKMLRIDVNGGTPYAISAAIRGLAAQSFGPRSGPWCTQSMAFQFRSSRRRLWIGDVGQGAWEEIDLESVEAQAGSTGAGAVGKAMPSIIQSVTCPSPQQPQLTTPIYEYDQTGPCYHGRLCLSWLAKQFLLWTILLCGLLQPFQPVMAAGTLRHGQRDRTDYTLSRRAGPKLSLPPSFGQDASGDLYVTDDSSSNGEVFKLNLRPTTCVAANYDVNGDGAVTVLDILWWSATGTERTTFRILT